MRTRKRCSIPPQPAAGGSGGHRYKKGKRERDGRKRRVQHMPCSMVVGRRFLKPFPTTDGQASYFTWLRLGCLACTMLSCVSRAPSTLTSRHVRGSAVSAEPLSKPSRPLKPLKPPNLRPPRPLASWHLGSKPSKPPNLQPRLLPEFRQQNLQTSKTPNQAPSAEASGLQACRCTHQAAHPRNLQNLQASVHRVCIGSKPSKPPRPPNLQASKTSKLPKPPKLPKSPDLPTAPKAPNLQNLRAPNPTPCPSPSA